jgi:hypothetical protein
MRATLCLALALVLVGCRDKIMPGSRAPEASPEQLATLQAGNSRLAAKLVQHGAETKKLPENLEALRAWAGASKTWDAEDDRALNDPWGHPVVYSVVPTIGLTFTLRSLGPDGKDKTPDDLTYDSRDGKTLTFEARNG